jgi:D-glycero-D-manno-heptose 1,7-bisphosphate phosphatase
MKGCILLDRDGVLNEERGDYVFHPEDFVIPADVPAGLRRLKDAGFALVVVTNQGGISKGLYTAEDVKLLHAKLQESCGGIIDFLFYAPWHRSISASLSAKPGSLMLERGMALTDSVPEKSWIIGDAERDLKAGAEVGVKGILIPSHKEQDSPLAECVCRSFTEAVEFILASVQPKNK